MRFDAAVFAVGVGRTIRGTMAADELQAYRVFWKSFFERTGARVCWFEPSGLPTEVAQDGTRRVNTKYFTSDCPPAL